jgi:hypothetical protein
MQGDHVATDGIIYTSSVAAAFSNYTSFYTTISILRWNNTERIDGHTLMSAIQKKTPDKNY